LRCDLESPNPLQWIAVTIVGDCSEVVAIPVGEAFDRRVSQRPALSVRVERPRHVVGDGLLPAVLYEQTRAVS